MIILTELGSIVVRMSSFLYGLRLIVIINEIIDDEKMFVTGCTLVLMFCEFFRFCFCFFGSGVTVLFR